MRFLVRLPLLSHSQTPMDIGAVGKGKSGKGGKKELANVTIRLSKHVAGAETRITFLQTALTLTKRAENVERFVIWQVCVSIFWNSSAQGGQGWSEGQGRWQRCECSKICWSCGESGEMSSQCPKKKVHAVEESTTASQAGSQDTIMVGSVEATPMLAARVK